MVEDRHPQLADAYALRDESTRLLTLARDRINDSWNRVKETAVKRNSQEAILERIDDRPTAASVWRDFADVVRRCPDRHAALTEMTRMIANRLDVDVCSIYELESETGELVLAATMGLNQNAVRNVRMPPRKGLVGLVAQELQPGFVEDAPSHKRFHYFPEAGEDPFVSFLGVPILLTGVLRGVLVVQTADWAVVAVAAQRLAPFV